MSYVLAVATVHRRLTERELEQIRTTFVRGRTQAVDFWFLRHKPGGGWAIFFQFNRHTRQKLRHDLPEFPSGPEALFVARDALLAYPGRFSTDQIADLLGMLTSLVEQTLRFESQT